MLNIGNLQCGLLKLRIIALTVPMVAFAVSAAAGPGGGDSPNGPTPFQDNLDNVQIKSMSPSVEGTGGSNVLKLEGQTAGATPTAVYYGGVPATSFTYDSSNSTISAEAPDVPWGEAVQVSVVFSDGRQVSSPVPYSRNAGYLEVVGPRPYDPSAGGDGA